MQAMLEELAEGNRVTLEDAITLTLSFTARLETRTTRCRRWKTALDIADGHIELNLLDLKEGGGGKAGPAVRITANGSFPLSSWDGAAVSSLTVLVEDFTGLAEFIRNGYAGRLVDVLDVRMT